MNYDALKQYVVDRMAAVDKIVDESEDYKTFDENIKSGIKRAARHMGLPHAVISYFIKREGIEKIKDSLLKYSIRKSPIKNFNHDSRVMLDSAAESLLNCLDMNGFSDRVQVWGNKIFESTLAELCSIGLFAKAGIGITLRKECGVIRSDYDFDIDTEYGAVACEIKTRGDCDDSVAMVKNVIGSLHKQLPGDKVGWGIIKVSDKQAVKILESQSVRECIVSCFRNKRRIGAITFIFPVLVPDGQGGYHTGIHSAGFYNKINRFGVDLQNVANLLPNKIVSKWIFLGDIWAEYGKHHGSIDQLKQLLSPRPPVLSFNLTQKLTFKI